MYFTYKILIDYIIYIEDKRSMSQSFPQYKQVETRRLNNNMRKAYFEKKLNLVVAGREYFDQNNNK